MNDRFSAGAPSSGRWTFSLTTSSVSDTEFQEDAFLQSLRSAISRGRHHLLREQTTEGCWRESPRESAEWESEAILAEVFLGRGDSELARSCAARLEAMQQDDGRWVEANASGSDLDATLKGYFAMKISGRDGGDRAMRRARKWILASGGADRSGAITRLFFAALGQIPYECLGAVFPVFGRRSTPKTALDRLLRLAMGVFFWNRPVQAVPPECGIRELFLEVPSRWCRGGTDSPQSRRASSVGRFRHPLRNGIIRLLRTITPPLLRNHCKSRSIAELTAFSQENSLSIESMLWGMMAGRVLGLEEDHPAMAAFREKLQACVESTEESPAEILPIGPKIRPIRLAQPSIPLRRTSEVVGALRESGSRKACPQVDEAVRWFLSQSIEETAGGRSETGTRGTVRGRAVRVRWGRTRFGERETTERIALLLKLLSPELPAEDEGHLPADLRFLHQERCGSRDAAHRRVCDFSEKQATIELSRKRLMARQKRDGSWSSSCRKGSSSGIGDRIAMTCDALEALLCSGSRPEDVSIRRGVRFLKRSQAADGSWPSPNHVSRTGQVLSVLRSAGLEADDSTIAAGANWLLSCRREGGGWSEEASREKTESASVETTARAVLGLLFAARCETSAVKDGIAFLMARQAEDGSWEAAEIAEDPPSSLTSSAMTLRALARFARLQHRERRREQAAEILQMTPIRIHDPGERSREVEEAADLFRPETPRWSPRLFRGE